MLIKSLCHRCPSLSRKVNFYEILEEAELNPSFLHQRVQVRAFRWFTWVWSRLHIYLFLVYLFLFFIYFLLGCWRFTSRRYLVSWFFFLIIIFWFFVAFVHSTRKLSIITFLFLLTNAWSCCFCLCKDRGNSKKHVSSNVYGILLRFFDIYIVRIFFKLFFPSGC